MNKSYIWSIEFCCKFRQLHFCQILFKLVFISQCYHESLMGELFETHCVATEQPCQFLAKFSFKLGIYTVSQKKRH